ncbi:class I SAM-dependent methyltransferase [Mammaliicoccus sciuri]|uniref:class I SAM-dependent DNA methyltransferase n=1 Tax=Mammaliicoccus sciuri TaxID=1296 RepID=UPI002DB6D291|nr:class I SAM-dependent methyltransferase [Mammaliicoccus sciuri]MEB7414653.1 class I SAM-dependent methyltransferase [Mammaliicoccus sciuri]
MTNIYDQDDFFEGYKQKRNHALSYNEVVEMPEMKRLMPDLNGKTVLDIGCGMGHLIAYMLKLHSKHITGIDESLNMINASREKFNTNNVTLYHESFMDFETNETYDVTVSSLVFHYIEDFKRCAKKLNQLLNSGGTLLFTMEHYFDESSRSANWLGADVYKYHHTIETIFNNLIENDFEIQCVKDLGQSEEVFKMYDQARINKLKQFPPFLLVKAKKK